ncbi:MAG TPA: ComF family protein [Burkholderiales bacterium]
MSSGRGQELESWIGRDCLLCGAQADGEFFCGGCATTLPGLTERCPQCALPTPGSAVCGNCLGRPPHFDRTTALWRYEFPCDRLVQALKYRGRLAVAQCFARRLAAEQLPRAHLLLPMPLHPRRLRARGFNQALEIARRLARFTGMQVEARGALRAKNTRPQTELPYDERAKNVRGAFACRLDLSGKVVGVVDDVMTTGATLNELARVLKEAGAARVENIVVARTVLP